MYLHVMGRKLVLLNKNIRARGKNMHFMKSSVGRKIVMAVTGVVMLSFIVIHVLGNSTIYFGWLNAYAEHLHALPPLVWAFRLVMLTVFSVHVFFGIQLSLENSAARPEAYAVKKDRRATFAGKNMIWTGGIIAGFLIYHLLHFTLHVTNPAISAGAAGNVDTLGRPDVFKMVVLSFQQAGIAAIYILSMIALALHLSHGAQSFLQTLGLNNDKTIEVFEKIGIAAAVIFFIGYASIPIAVFVGILKS
jgi:succinate dehydrogenase / fumarate reductase cytochrome b subunit